MIENLCMYGLPFASRQNEMIEMALTFKFTGIEVDLDEMGRRAEAMGQDFATQFVNSAKIEVASFKLPIDFGAEEEAYAAQKERLESLCAIAEAIEAKRCYAVIAPGSDRLAFQENFELQRGRIAEIAERLAKSSIKLGLCFDATPANKAKFEYQFICKAEELLALVKTVGNDNVGLALDTWHWELGEGAMDQIKELETSKIFDIRLADLRTDHDPAKVTQQDRAAPSRDETAFAVKLLKHVHENGYEDTVSVVCSFPDFNDRSRGVKTVEKIRSALNGVLKQAGIIEEEFTVTVGMPEVTRHDSRDSSKNAESSEDKTDKKTDDKTENKTDEKTDKKADEKKDSAASDKPKAVAESTS